MTERQMAILAGIIEQYAELSYPVGSVTLAKAFKVSSATIRAEMAELERLDYISQPHTSAGRIPTDKGYRWYVNNIVTPQSTPETIDQVKVFDTRVRGAGDPDQAVRSAVKSLVDITTNVGLGTFGRQIYTSGLDRLLSHPEFADPDNVRAVAYLLDNLDVWLREVGPTKPVSVFIGSENPIGKTSGCSLIISCFSAPSNPSSYIGVIGPTRQNYRQTVALVRHAGETLESILNN